MSFSFRYSAPSILNTYMCVDLVIILNILKLGYILPPRFVKYLLRYHSKKRIYMGVYDV